MEQPLVNRNNIMERARYLPSDRLIGYDSRQLIEIAEQLYLELTQSSDRNTPPKIILADRNPIRFLAGFIAATSAGCPLFLCNPDWVQAEWQQVLDLVQPDLIWGEKAASPNPSNTGGNQIQNRIMIPTGGSSGQIRFAIHTWETLTASVQGFTQYFKLDRVNSFCVLPLYHVSGLMQFMRSFITGGKLALHSLKALENSQINNIEPSEFFISLVPTQLQRLLDSNPTWLSRFQTVLLGGAPAWDELLVQARSHRIRLALTYGMTETASQIATLKPEDFISGNNSCGQVLPHAKVTICSGSGEILDPNKTGIITIQADSLAYGYYPDRPLEKYTDDLGYFDDRGYLNIIGRNSNKIITGGENVFPSEVEDAIRSTNLVRDICAIGLPDSHWGQAVTAVYIPSHPKVSNETLQTAIEDKLTKFKRPKHWIEVESLPRNDRGKVHRKQIQEIAIMWLQRRSNLPANQ